MLTFSALARTFQKPVVQSIYYTLVFLLLLLYAAAILASDGIGRFNFYTIRTGSMAPALPVGSYIVVKRQPQYSQGDVITFNKLAQKVGVDDPETITHRIVRVRQEDQQYQYLTAGDAVEHKDGWIGHNRVVGEVVAALPLLGSIVQILKTQWAKIFFIYIPVSSIILVELSKIIKEFKRSSL